MPQDDRHFEEFLQRFEPLGPRELPAEHAASTVLWQFPTAIAAMLLLAAVITLWEGSEPPSPHSSAGAAGITQPAPAVTIGQFNALLRRNPAQLDAALTEASRHLLPDVRQPDGMLHVLARD